MFENLLYQPSASLLEADINKSRLPGAILLSGPSAAGKLTCALEIARVLSCTGSKKGDWTCSCPSCKKNRALAYQNILLMGPRDCSLEILAARKAFLEAAVENRSYLPAARFLFLRSVRKLSNRFSQILWEGDDKVSKIAPVTQAIDELMERIDSEKPLPEYDDLDKITGDLVKQAQKLEDSFMYDSIPINLIRKAENWARQTSAEGKKTIIIENAERMNENARNALLKILEEPPTDAVFILTTSRRGAVMPTILSRVRTYSFAERNQEQQTEVLERVFHCHEDEKNLSVETYLQTFLPAEPSQIEEAAYSFYKGICERRLLNCAEFVKACENFEPRLMLKIFLNGIIKAQVSQVESPAFAEASAKNLEAIRTCYSDVTLYNQTPLAALENLYRELASIRRSLR